MEKNIRSNKSLLRLSLVANAFEWYEFSICSFLSPILGKLFFNTTHPTMALLKAFMLLAVGYLVRPIGSLFFGLRGDRIGRRYAMRLSLILMAIPTVLIGLLPTYDQIGMLATLSLFLLRIIQGFAIGGELPITACYVFESAQARYRSLLCSTAAVGPVIGILFGSLVNLGLTTYFESEVIYNGAWRLPFLLSLPLSLFIAHVREKVEETPVFLQMKTIESHGSKPLLKPLIKAIFLFTFFYVEGPILMIWMPFYLNHFLHVPLEIATFSHSLTLLAMVPSYFLCGYISQRWGYRKLLSSSILTSLLLVIPIFKGLQLYPSFSVLFFLQMLLALLVSSSNGLFVEIAGHLFKPETRCLGTSLTCAIPAALIGGTIPLVCTHIIHKTGWLMFPAYYIIATGLLALPVALYLIDDTPSS